MLYFDCLCLMINYLHVSLPLMFNDCITQYNNLIHFEFECYHEFEINMA